MNIYSTKNTNVIKRMLLFELWSEIFTYLNYEDKAKCRRVNKTWKNELDRKVYWRIEEVDTFSFKSFIYNVQICRENENLILSIDKYGTIDSVEWYVNVNNISYTQIIKDIWLLKLTNNMVRWLVKQSFMIPYLKQTIFDYCCSSGHQSIYIEKVYESLKLQLEDIKETNYNCIRIARESLQNEYDNDWVCNDDYYPKHIYYWLINKYQISDDKRNQILYVKDKTADDIWNELSEFNL